VTVNVALVMGDFVLADPPGFHWAETRSAQTNVLAAVRARSFLVSSGVTQVEEDDRIQDFEWEKAGPHFGEE